jgi:hypothetical protein
LVSTKMATCSASRRITPLRHRSGEKIEAEP